MMNTANVTRKSALSTAIEVLSAMPEYAEVAEKLQSMLTVEENRKATPKKPKEATAEEVAMVEAIESYMGEHADGVTVKELRENIEALAGATPSKVASLLKKMGAVATKVTKTKTAYTL